MLQVTRKGNRVRLVARPAGLAIGDHPLGRLASMAVGVKHRWRSPGHHVPLDLGGDVAGVWGSSRPRISYAANHCRRAGAGAGRSFLKNDQLHRPVGARTPDPNKRPPAKSWNSF
jgi:hypothetical protein